MKYTKYEEGVNYEYTKYHCTFLERKCEISYGRYDKFEEEEYTYYVCLSDEDDWDRHYYGLTKQHVQDTYLECLHHVGTKEFLDEFNRICEIHGLINDGF